MNLTLSERKRGDGASAGGFGGGEGRVREVSQGKTEDVVKSGK